MILSVFSRRPGPQATIRTLYGAIVAQARLPIFYLDYGVPDTSEGRFDMIVLHLALLLRRLKPEPAAAELGQGLVDLFCRDMDDNLREMGVGDLTVPKQVQRMAEALQGRTEAYDRALDEASDQGLAAALARNVYGSSGEAPSAEVQRLAGYVRRAAQALATEGIARLTAGELQFVSPDANSSPQPN